MDVPVPKTKFRQIHQICIVVHDARAAMRRYWETVGIGPWKLYTLGGPNLPQKDMTYRGRPAQFKVLMALANIDNIQFELIQPLEGPTIYQDYLDAHGEGVQHLAMLVDDIDEEVAAAEANGIAVIQSGKDITEGKSGFAYLDTEGRVHVTFEFVQRPGESSGPAPLPGRGLPAGVTARGYGAPPLTRRSAAGVREQGRGHVREWWTTRGE